VTTQAPATPGRWLPEPEALRLLATYDLPVIPHRLAASPDEAAAAAQELGFPVVLKIVSPDIIHKSDVGGVALNVPTPGDARTAFTRIRESAARHMPNAAVDGVVVARMAAPGTEVILGMLRDPQFGPAVMAGLGGVFVELLGDIAFRIHPLTDVDVADMIGEVKASKLLDGYRGADPGDIPALRDALLRVSALIDDLPEIAEMDLNPVKVLPPGQGLCVVDLRMRVRPVPQRWLPSRKDIPAVQRNA